MSSHEFADNAQASRYELREGPQVLAFAQYALDGQRMQFTHTQVDAAHEGRGLGSELARHALGDARRRGLQVVPACPFIAEYMQRNPQDGQAA
ncbi:GNAT family N-acetyltransferase [Ramlibacter rhizophilus]|uniref:N-acetyltransferase n=1 Tax=Ramlibacter rhizophilus TaxID=1781167 RepID=A0A4Z0BF00_9BURK|nr:GNAT family N-acetyltransferase [Ramlibacter rhizophilus]TFY97400.1 N-acetyltransferase [Ramlibacter rhizophilus]